MVAWGAEAQTLDEIKAMPVSEGLWYALEYYDVMEPHVVYAQAVLETGWFKSRLAQKGNLFGLYDSRGHRYRTYDHWVESVKDYRDSVQCKYKGGDYYYFLEQLPYAADPDYVRKVRQLAKQFVDPE